MTSEEEIVKLRMALAEAVDEIDVLKARLTGTSRGLCTGCRARPSASGTPWTA